MKIYDFDAKFYDYARTWMALHPGLKEDEIEQHYNDMMRSWLNAPAQWLGGVKPGEYFDRYSDPRDLIRLLEEYLKRDIGLPEPLYSRIVAVGAPCAAYLVDIVRSPDRPDALRGTALALLRDMNCPLPLDLCLDVICSGDTDQELSDMVAESLKDADESIVETLMDHYDSATEYGRMTILDICAKYPVHDRVFEKIVYELNHQDRIRGYYAGLLADYGDPRALNALQSAQRLSDLTYLDYIEIRNAIEALGGDPGEERVFNGDDAYEALRNM